MEAVFLTEAGGARDYGHVVRSGALRDAFTPSGAHTKMWVDSDQILDERIVAGASTLIGNWKKELERALPTDRSGETLVVVDSYEADLEVLDEIAARSRACCWFDDNARIEYPDGTLVNAAIGADALYTARRLGIRYLTGPRYAILRKDFWTNRPYRVRERIERVLISMGSGVSAEKVRNMAETLQDATGGSDCTVLNESAPSLTRTDELSGICWRWGLSPEEIIDLAIQSDVAVSSGGQSLIELACIGIPAISVLTADNQICNVSGFEKTGFSVAAGSLKDPDFLDRLWSCARVLAPAQERSLRSDIGRGLIDGKGAFRVMRAVTEG